MGTKPKDDEELSDENTVDTGITKPEFDLDAIIDREQESGKRLKKFQFPRMNIGPSPETRRALLNAIMGGAAAIEATKETSQIDQPLLSAVQGLNAGLQTPRKAAMDASMQDLGMRKASAGVQSDESMLEIIDKKSPALIQKYPELSGLTIEQVGKIAPILQRQEAMQNRLSLAMMQMEKMANQGILTARDQQLLEGLFGFAPGTLKGVSKAVGANIAPKPLSPEAAKMSSSAQSGLQKISEIKELLSKTDRLTLAKATNPAREWTSIGDPNAQKLSIAAKEASDVITRLRTGAALNASEEKYYQGLLLDWRRDPVANAYALDTVASFLQQVDQQLTSGQRVPGQNFQALIIPKQSAAAPPAGAAGGKTMKVGKYNVTLRS